MRTSTVIVTNDGDLTADSVVRHMDPDTVIRLDPADLHTDYIITASLDAEGGWRTIIETPHRAIEVGPGTSVWWRKPTMPEGIQDDDEAWVADENQAALLGLLRAARVRIWVNDPDTAARAGLKAPQLTLARRLGLNTPETLLTNDPLAAAKFVQRYQDVVVKAMRQKRTLFIPTTTVLPGADLSDVAGAMHQFQRRIDKAWDARIVAIGERLFPVKIVAPGLDVRTARREDQSYSAIAAPGHVAKALRTYMREERLAYCAFDFVGDAAGAWYFLEANPGGEFLYLQEATGMAMARAMAEYLHQRPAW